jgi:hypothetical protein
LSRDIFRFSLLSVEEIRESIPVATRSSDRGMMPFHFAVITRSLGFSDCVSCLFPILLIGNFVFVIRANALSIVCNGRHLEPQRTDWRLLASGGDTESDQSRP